MSKNRVLIIDDDARIGRVVQRVANKLRVDTSVIDNPDLFESTYLRYQPNIIFFGFADAASRWCGAPSQVG